MSGGMKALLERGIGLVLVLGMVSGCLPGGERARGWGYGGDGGEWEEGGGGGSGSNCIPGEVCSDATPGGLYFKSAGFFDSFFQSGPETVAVGGVETILVYRDTQGGKPFDLPFDAATTGVMSVQSTSGASVAVTAGKDGTGYLRLVEPGTELLYDRFQLTAAAVTQMRLGPMEAFPFFDPAIPQISWALLASSTTPLVVSLLGGEARLIDESIDLTVSGNATVDDQYPTWDRYFVTVGASGSVTLTGKLGSGKLASVTMPIVEKADDIVPLPSSEIDSPDAPLTTKKSGHYCFRAMSSGKGVAGTTYVVTGSDELGVGDGLWPGCVVVHGSKPGTATLTVEAAGAKKTFSIKVVTAAAATEGSTPAWKIPASTPLSGGQRAAAH